MGKLEWYYRRLMTMSLKEVGYRIRNEVVFRLQRHGYMTAAQPPAPDLSTDGISWAGIAKGLEPEIYAAQAREVASGRLKVFALSDAELGSPPDWNVDPLTKVEAPSAFGKTLDYRDENLVGDIKYLWEPNRHLQLVRIAQAYALTGDERCLTDLRVQLGAWFDQCPYLIGPNWSSSLELGIRLINWSLVWQYVGGVDSALFDGDDGRDFRRRWLESIYQHMHFIDGHYSRFSSANNHLIGEAAGVVVACKTWPYWDDCKRFERVGIETLEREIRQQNYADGVNKEQAVSYQQFVLDFVIIAGLACKAAGTPLSGGYWRQVESMIEYLAALVDYGGNVPMIGDADDGYAVRLGHESDFCPYRSLLATGAVLFERGDFKAKASGLDAKTLWLLGAEAESRFDMLPAAPGKQRMAFEEGGYYFLGKDWGEPDEIKAVVDCGQLGYLSIAAHGHADALAMCLSVGGYEFLVDVGTYAYHTQKKWRNYFRGTSAHNTVRVDGLDQSVMGGNFMWTERASAQVSHFSATADGVRFQGRHDGYQRLGDPVTHSREIVFDNATETFFIKDVLACEKTHGVEWFWHFHEACSVVPQHDGVKVTHGERSISLRALDSDLQVSVVSGDEDKPLGWVSRSFDVKVPSTTVVMSGEIFGNKDFCFEIAVDACI